MQQLSRNNILSILFGSALLLIVCAASSVLTCGVNEAICGTQCYSLATHVCINGTLCGVNLDVCAGHCYNPVYYTCDNNVLRGATSQELSERPCGDVYNPSKTCGLNELCCGESYPGTSCYNAFERNCVDNLIPTVIAGNRVECKKGFIACPLRNEPRSTCINPSVYRCVNAAPGNRICPLGVTDLNLCATGCSSSDPNMECNY